MKPVALRGHARPLTYVQYNREGDLVFSCAKDNTPTVWWANNGERLGNYKGHNGAVWACDVDQDTNRLVTASADQCVKIWDVETGIEMYSIMHKSPMRECKFGLGQNIFFAVSDGVMGQKPTVWIYKLDGDGSPQEVKHIQLESKVHRAVWGPLNKSIICAHTDGTVTALDPETEEVITRSNHHTDKVFSLYVSKDGTEFITGSKDCTSALMDIKTLEVLRTYKTTKPVNAAAISPLYDHVIVGGGQDAMDVTTTDLRSGKFEVRFFHKVFEEELGSVTGHFGPINALAFSPDGHGFTSGGEDGYVRLHHFDDSYFEQADEFAALDEDDDEM